MITLTKKNLAFLLVVLFILAGLSFVQAWTGPTLAPPNGNISAPVNVGTSDQVKNAGLSVNSLAVFGNSLLSGNTGFGQTARARVDVQGSVLISETLATNPGRFYSGASDEAAYDEEFAITMGIPGGPHGDDRSSIYIGPSPQGNMGRIEFNAKTLSATVNNFGIGTSSPSQKLSVSGKIYSTGGIQFADGTLQTTASSASAPLSGTMCGFAMSPSSCGGASFTSISLCSGSNVASGQCPTGYSLQTVTIAETAYPSCGVYSYPSHALRFCVKN